MNLIFLIFFKKRGGGYWRGELVRRNTVCQQTFYEFENEIKNHWKNCCTFICQQKQKS